MSKQITQSEIKAVLKKNGIHSIDDLTKMLIENDSAPGIISKKSSQASPLNWIISFWRLPNLIKDHRLDDLPNELGGELLK